MWQLFQEKTFKEQYAIFGESDRAVTSTDLHEMHYLEMVIKETLRLYPSVPYISRLLTEDLKLRKYFLVIAINSSRNCIKVDVIK